MVGGGGIGEPRIGERGGKGGIGVARIGERGGGTRIGERRGGLGKQEYGKEMGVGGCCRL
jgi:hypothetical protein